MRKYVFKIIVVIGLWVILFGVRIQVDRQSNEITSEIVNNQKENVQTHISDYDTYLNKIWIVDRMERKLGEAFDFVITRIEDGNIQGYIRIAGGVERYYWDNVVVEDDFYHSFIGTIHEDKAESVFQYKEHQVQVYFHFCENEIIEAEIKSDELNMKEKYQFRPYNLSDKMLHDDISTTKIFLDSWGMVNLASATTDANHSIPWVYITNEKGDILYQLCCSKGINGGIVFWDVFVEDINKDGRQDIWTVVCADSATDGGRIVSAFYQLENGHFKEQKESTQEIPKEYYGDYKIVQFCPSNNYSAISEKVLTQQEVNQLIGQIVTIQDGLFVTYDSERRLGTRNDRELPKNENMVLEFRYEYTYCYSWQPVYTENSMFEWQLNSVLQEAVGEEYYEKINGIIFNRDFGIQQFYTLIDEDKLIMHSLLTGQHFIMEKIKDEE